MFKLNADGVAQIAARHPLNFVPVIMSVKLSRPPWLCQDSPVVQRRSPRLSLNYLALALDVTSLRVSSLFSNRMGTISPDSR